ncbi:mycoredoxin [Gordonia sp. NPDC003424]
MSNVIDDDPQTRISDTGVMTIYTTSWCGFCARLKTGLKSLGLSWQEVDIELNPDAAEWVGSVNGGNHTVPTVLFADGTTVTNPSVAEVRAKLGV